MPSGWDIYYVVFLSALMALLIPVSLALLSRVLASDSGRRSATPPTPPPTATQARRLPDFFGKRINVRFFLAVNAALALLALVLALVPCVGMLQPTGDSGQTARGLVAIVSIGLFAALGLLYSARKGDLSWIETLSRSEKGGDE